MQFIQTLFSQDGWQLVGRFHVILIHFPVALLIAAGMVEAFGIVRRRTTPHPAALACLVIGTAAAVVSATTGWAHADYTTFPGQADTVLYHRLLGIASAVLGLVVLALHQRARAGSIANLRLYQVVALVTAGVVGFTGHLGGTLTHGEDFLVIHKPSVIASTTTRPLTTRPLATLPATTSAAAPVSYEQVQPILSKSCYFCHGPMKQRAGLRVDSVAAMVQGGNGGPAIIPGNSQDSLLIHRVLGLDNQPRMPDKKPPLPDEQIQLLRQWIDSMPATTSKKENP